MPSSSSAGPVLLYVACGHVLRVLPKSPGTTGAMLCRSALSSVQREEDRRESRGTESALWPGRFAVLGTKKKPLLKKIPGDRDVL